MPFVSFREAYQRLESSGGVLKVEEELSADFEAPLLVKEASRRSGKAVLIPRVQGKKAPLVSAIYYGKSPEDLGLGRLEELCQRYSSWVSLFDNPPIDSSDKLAILASISWIAERFPKIVQFPSSEYEAQLGYDLDLSRFPAVRHSPEEEAPSVVNPVIVVKATASKSFAVVSHPVEIADERTMLIAAPANSHLQKIINEAASTGSKISAAVIVGAPPSAQLASLVEWLSPADSFVLMGVLADSSALVAKLDDNFPIPLGSEIVLLGDIEPGDTRPGGRLLQEDGYLAEESALPVFKPRKALVRKKAMFYTSIVDYEFSDVVQLNRWRDKLLLAHLQRSTPIVKDLRVLPETAFKAVAVSVKRARTRDLVKLGLQLLSMRVSAKLRMVIFVDEEVDVNSPVSILSSVINYAIPEENILEFTRSHEVESSEETEVLILATSSAKDHLAEKPGDEVLRRVEDVLKRLLPEARDEKTL